MNIQSFSKKFAVRVLDKKDVSRILFLCQGNELYYEYCPPFATRESIIEDLNALPPEKTPEDKFYIGFFNGKKLIAVMDFIRDYPEKEKAFIGFFMTDKSVQNQGTGSLIISELCEYLSSVGFFAVRLAWVKGNPQAEHFWLKNGFSKIGESHDTNGHEVVLAERKL